MLSFVFNGLRREVIVRFVDNLGIVDHYNSNIFLIMNLKGEIQQVLRNYLLNNLGCLYHERRLHSKYDRC